MSGLWSSTDIMGMMMDNNVCNTKKLLMCVQSHADKRLKHSI